VPLVDTEEMSILNFSLTRSPKKVVNDPLANHKRNDLNLRSFWVRPITLRLSTDQILQFKSIAPEICGLAGRTPGAPFETGGTTQPCRAK
jgi:hypothetical protein